MAKKRKGKTFFQRLCRRICYFVGCLLGYAFGLLVLVSLVAAVVFLELAIFGRISDYSYAYGWNILASIVVLVITAVLFIIWFIWTANYNELDLRTTLQELINLMNIILCIVLLFALFLSALQIIAVIGVTISRLLV